MSLSSEIKEYALSLGYDRVGFTTAEEFPIYEKELTERRHMYDWTAEGGDRMLKSADPKNIPIQMKWWVKWGGFTNGAGAGSQSVRHAAVCSGSFWKIKDAK